MEVDILGYEMVGSDTIEGDSLVEYPPKDGHPPPYNVFSVGIQTKSNQCIIAWYDNKGSHRSGTIEVRLKKRTM